MVTINLLIVFPIITVIYAASSIPQLSAKFSEMHRGYDTCLKCQRLYKENKLHETLHIKNLPLNKDPITV